MRIIDLHHLNNSSRIYICYLSCLFFFPTAGAAEFSRLTHDTPLHLILPYFVSYSRIRLSRGPR